MPQRLRPWLWLLWLGCTQVWGSTLNVPAEEADEFHFVVLGDAQFHDATKFNRIIDQTRRLRPAFVIQVGDLIEGYQSDLSLVEAEWQRFARQIAPLAPIPFLAVPGNHDVMNHTFTADPQLEQLYVRHWGPLYWSFVYKHTRFIGLNSDDSTTGSNQIAGEQLAWLEHTLAAANSDVEHTFVFLHRPPQLMPNAEALHELFRQHGVSHVFYGHLHHYHHMERDGIRYIMTNAAANSVNGQPSVGGFHHLLQVAVRGDEVDVAVIEADAIRAIDAVEPQDNFDLFALTRGLAPAEIPLQATASERFTLTLPLHNTSRRDIEVLLQCSSADQRWMFSPNRIPALALAAGAQQTLLLDVGFEPQRAPESAPVCDLRVPFQTAKGEWLQFEHRITGIR